MSVRLDHGDIDLAELHEINVTPFIDVILVLLIIFMIAAPLATVDVAVDLPTSNVCMRSPGRTAPRKTAPSNSTRSSGPAKASTTKVRTAVGKVTILGNGMLGNPAAGGQDRPWLCDAHLGKARFTKSERVYLAREFCPQRRPVLRTSLCHKSNRSAARRNGNWKMASRDWGLNPPVQDSKLWKLPTRDSPARA
jgi:hypothetical protein